MKWNKTSKRAERGWDTSASIGMNCLSSYHLCRRWHLRLKDTEGTGVMRGENNVAAAACVSLRISSPTDRDRDGPRECWLLAAYSLFIRPLSDARKASHAHTHTHTHTSRGPVTGALCASSHHRRLHCQCGQPAGQRRRIPGCALAR